MPATTRERLPLVAAAPSASPTTTAAATTALRLHALHLLLARLDRFQIEAEIPKLALGACDQPARCLLCSKATFHQEIDELKNGPGMAIGISPYSNPLR